MPMFGATAAAWFANVAQDPRGQTSFVGSGEVDLGLVEAAKGIGYSVWADGDIASIGAAVLDDGGAPLAVLVVIVPIFRTTSTATATTGELIRSAAHELSGG